FFLFFSLPPRPLTSTLFPYTTLFRSLDYVRRNCRRIRSQDAWCSSAAGEVHRSGSWSMTGKGSGWRKSGSPGDVLCGGRAGMKRSEEHTSELQSRGHLVCRLLLEKKK